MKKRRLSREFAFRFLYQRDANGLLRTRSAGKVTGKDFENFKETAGEDMPYDREFAHKLAEGVCENIEEIDSQIEIFSENWKISRMSPIDVNIMRVAVYELLYVGGIDKAVSINEAMEMAHKYGGEKSGAFINGVLDKINAREPVGNA